ncbi:oxidoreductase [Celerinatantimonas diazotrophica]|uniref:Putative dehydrogenase n=1 Tax=Celerinatantimonas diazotrophica TaxID=412034 RepID=A0A4R1KFB0_9GAMM|nr:oxidoreductase [Celerinatantimonas diazotrophica]TCK63376.1 putative dehydrogenase [Celerinatantimonas diazotrophica]CAG9294920.1 putative oxidoreductase YdgJ [Celerinatantimonas diazotrophica]
MQPIRVGVIGYGNSAKTFHLPFINALPMFELVAISSSQSDALNAEYPNVAHYPEAMALIEQSNAELVIITAPNQAHYPLASAAIEKGLHVLLEKPFVIDIKQGQALIEQAKQANVKLSVYHNRRWDGDFLTVKQLIEENKLGKLKVFQSHYDRFRPEVKVRWREDGQPGSGILYDLGSHLIDQALALFGRPLQISADVLAMRDGSPAIDYFHLTLHYADHLVILHSSSLSAGPVLRFRLEGQQGSYVKYGIDPQEDQIKAGIVDTNSTQQAGAETGVLYTAQDETQITNIQGGYHHFYRQLAESLIHDTPLPVSAEQALDTIRVIQLAEQSQIQQQTLDFCD